MDAIRIKLVAFVFWDSLMIKVSTTENGLRVWQVKYNGMNTKILKEKVAIELNAFFGSYVFTREKKSFRWLKPQPFGWDDIGIRFIYTRTSYVMELGVGRRFEAVESILGPIFQKPNYYRNDGTDVTLAFCANKVDNINSATRGYSFPMPDYDHALNQMELDFTTKIYPVLERTDTVEKLNNFINNPPETFEEKVYFFPLDGGTLFRKMIISRLVDKDYELVCSYVFNFFKEAIASGAALNPIYDHLQIYHDLKNHLDHNVQPQNV